MKLLNSLPGNAWRAMTVAAALSLTACDAVNEAVEALGIAPDTVHRDE